MLPLRGHGKTESIEQKRHISLMTLLSFMTLYLGCFFAVLFETLDDLRGRYCQFTPSCRISLAVLQPQLEG